MIKFSGSVLFIDNNCLVYILDFLYPTNKKLLINVFSILILEFDQVWIPRTVENEFLCKREDRRRKRELDWAIQYFKSLRICPITVSRLEIVSLIGNTEEDAGEADAVLQMNKGKISDTYEFKKITFFTADKKAANMVKKHGHEVLEYDSFKSRILESGIILP